MKIFISILFLIILQEAHANMRRCLLLPIYYENDETLSFKIFEEVENYLRMSHWCRYQSNSAILEIISPQKTNLESYFRRNDVLKSIAKKTNSGSLIKIVLEPMNKGINLSIKVVGSNGSDTYLKKNTSFKRANSYLVSQMIKNWLEEFQQTIPYDGLVIDVLGGQFTIDIGSDSELYVGSEISVFRPGKKRHHPLLKEIVEYDRLPIGEGKISQVSKKQGQGKMVAYEASDTVSVGDWIKIKEHQKREYLQIDKYKRKNTYKFGKIGEWGIFFPLGYAHPQNSQQGDRMLELGLEFVGELWITRKYWTSLTYGRNLGIFGNQGLRDNSRLRFRAGYRYLPLDFFHGPQINAFAGYGKYQYKSDSKSRDYASFQGFLLGISCHLPLRKMFAFNAEFGIIPSLSYSENGSGSNYHLEVGFSYWYNPRMKLVTSYDFVNNNVSLADNENQIKAKESRLNMGFSFIF